MLIKYWKLWKKGLIQLKKSLLGATEWGYSSSTQACKGNNQGQCAFHQVFKLTRDDTLAFTQCHRSKKDSQVCGHPDKNVDDNSCAHCLAEYKVNDEQEEWMCCPLCKKWFHESCFHKLIIYYIFIVFWLFSLKVPFVNINLSDGQLTFRQGSPLILALISSNMS